MIGYLRKLERWQQRLLSIFVDVVSLLLITYLALWIRVGWFGGGEDNYYYVILILPLLCVPVFIKVGLYRAVIRYVSHRFIWVSFASVSLVFLLWATVMLMSHYSFPRSAFIMAWMFSVFYIVGSRMLVRWFILSDKKNESNAVIIFGAGNSGCQLMNAMVAMPNRKVVAFIDDNKKLQGNKIASVKVYSRKDLSWLIEKFDVKELLLAIPSLSPLEKKNILSWLEGFKLKISTLPGIDEIIDGKVSFSDVREVDIADLLGRPVIPPKQELLDACIKGRSVMVTGAGGSIGSVLCKKIVAIKPKCLVLFEISEFALYSIEQEIKRYLSDLGLSIKMYPILGSVQNEGRVKDVLSRFHISTVYHAAAYKHVPMVEHNIREGIENNSFGTYQLAKVCAENNVKNFVLISTDKAVRPTNIMGASKRLAELSLQALQDVFPETRFVMVRFGNVLGSSGSVIPLFKKQIAMGGPVTVTHKDITRFFMTISEAALLVIQAGSMGKGGDVFVLDMGESIKISDLAKKMIQLSGFSVKEEDGKGDIEIVYTGLRPGEKLYEELLIGHNVKGTEHPRIMKAHEDYLELEQLDREISQIKQYLNQYDFKSVDKVLKRLVDGYHHDSGISDFLVPKKTTANEHVVHFHSQG